MIVVRYKRSIAACGGVQLLAEWVVKDGKSSTGGWGGRLDVMEVWLKEDKLACGQRASGTLLSGNWYFVKVARYSVQNCRC
jgi:hypothetical protein